MKLTKKFLLVALAAFAFVFASCEQLNPTLGGDPDAEDSVSGTIINGLTSKAYVGKKDGDGYKNEGTSTVREMQLFATKHYGAFAALTLTGEESGKASNGQLGYVFNLTENKDGTVNFITIGYRYGSEDGSKTFFNTYVSQFYNIDTAKFSEPNFGCSAEKTAFDETVTTPYEIVVKPLNTKLEFVDFGTDDPTVGVEVVAEDDGSYTINYYAASKLDKFKLKKNQTADLSVPVPATVTGRTEKKQTKMGCYAAVYKNKTLNGFWRFSSIVGEGEVEEF